MTEVGRGALRCEPEAPGSSTGSRATEDRPPGASRCTCGMSCSPRQPTIPVGQSAQPQASSSMGIAGALPANARHPNGPPRSRVNPRRNQYQERPEVCAHRSSRSNCVFVGNVSGTDNDGGSNHAAQRAHLHAALLAEPRRRELTSTKASERRSSRSPSDQSPDAEPGVQRGLERAARRETGEQACHHRTTAGGASSDSAALNAVTRWT